MQKRTIVFDFGGVLFRTSASEFYRDRFEQQGRSEEELNYFLNTVFTREDRSLANSGLMSDIIEQKAKQHPEWAEEIRAIGADRDFIKQVRNVLPEMQQVIEEIAQRGDRIIGLTNWAGDTYDTLPKAFPHILDHFNDVVVSGKIRMKKPDPKIFELTQERIGNPNPADVYYFDDKARNIESAHKTVGWNGFVYENANTVRQALALKPKPF